MRVFEIKKGSTSLNEMHQTTRPDPKPGAGQVLVRVRAASLNYRDLAVVTGNYFGGSVTRDTIPLSDGAGEVAAVGEGVTRFKPGDRVAGAFFQGWYDGRPATRPLALGAPLDGMLTELAVLHEDGLVAIPDHLSFEEAAALPCAGVTAWNALMVTGRTLKPGEKVLTLGTGGVSMFALQFAKAAGAHVIITSSSDEKLDRARALGADMTVNYRATPDWEKEVLNLTGGLGVDHIVEVGGAGTLPRSYQALGYGGKIALIGVLARAPGDLNPHPLMLKAGSLHGIFVGNRKMFEDMNQAIAVNGLKPVIDRTFPFEDAPEAYRHLTSASHMGKVVITI